MLFGPDDPCFWGTSGAGWIKLCPNRCFPRAGTAFLEPDANWKSEFVWMGVVFYVFVKPHPINFRETSWIALIPGEAISPVGVNFEKRRQASVDFKEHDKKAM